MLSGSRGRVPKEGHGASVSSRAPGEAETLGRWCCLQLGYLGVNWLCHTTGHWVELLSGAGW